MFENDYCYVTWFARVTSDSVTDEIDNHDIDEILLKMVLNTNMIYIDEYSFLLYTTASVGAQVAQWVRSLDLTHASLSPIRRGFAPGFVN
jgi:hypothetical protein